MPGSPYTAELSAGIQTLVWTVDVRRTVQKIAFVNRAASSAAIKLWLVPFDEVLADQHTIVPNKALAAASVVFLLEHNYTVLPGNKFYAQSDINSVNVSIIAV